MFQKLVFLSVVALAFAATTATSEVKFVRPGEKPPGRAAEPEVGAMDLDTIYRGIDLLGRFTSRTSRGLIIGALVNDFARDDIDGRPGITDSDRELAARVEIAQARARTAQPWGRQRP